MKTVHSIGFFRWVRTGNAREMLSNHFADIGKMVQIGSGSEREITDFA